MLEQCDLENLECLSILEAGGRRTLNFRSSRMLANRARGAAELFEGLKATPRAAELFEGLKASLRAAEPRAAELFEGESEGCGAV